MHMGHLAASHSFVNIRCLITQLHCYLYVVLADGYTAICVCACMHICIHLYTYAHTYIYECALLCNKEHMFVYMKTEDIDEKNITFLSDDQIKSLPVL